MIYKKYIIRPKRKEICDLSPLSKCQLSLAEEGGGISDKTLETKFLLFLQLLHSKIQFVSGLDLQQESDIYFI